MDLVNARRNIEDHGGWCRIRNVDIVDDRLIRLREKLLIELEGNAWE